MKSTSLFERTGIERPLCGDTHLTSKLPETTAVTTYDQRKKGA